jgi:hypothetical protein
MQYLTLETIKIGNWLVKASLLEETILIFFYNEYTMVSNIKFFYDEVKAHEYLVHLTGE